ncbi:PEPxxWA-CTERM sorting domain-containing protein [Sphingomonas aliaeris]|nr:PEPxxWA-CTERM sorting domain-containing protein [Sphingomonas aliaeris]
MSEASSAQNYAQTAVKNQIGHITNRQDIIQSSVTGTIYNYDGVITSDSDFRPSLLLESRVAQDDYAVSYANLASGKIGAFVSTSGNADGSQNGGSTAFASYQDLLTFNVAGADDDTVTELKYRITLHGVATLGSGTLFGLRNQLGFSSFVYNGSRPSNITYYQTNFSDLKYTVGVDSAYFDVTSNITGKSYTQTFLLALEVLAVPGNIADYLHTASIKFDLPQEVTMSSSSGIFLTATDIGSVPETATWGMMIAGFGIMGAAMRTRRRSAKVSFA